LLEWRTIRKNILLPVEFEKKPVKQYQQKVDELLHLTGLTDFGQSYPRQLSGGMRQRAAICRALVDDPGLLLMDEPFGALDPIIRTKAREDLLAIQRRFGTTIIMVTHDMEEAVFLGDKIAVVDAGRLLQYATPAEIIARPASEFVESLVGSSERPFRLLSFAKVADIVEPLPATGEPISDRASLRDALAELLWSRRTELPVRDDAGNLIGRVTMDALIAHGAPPR